VIDAHGNALREQHFKLKWTRVCSLDRQVTVQENSKEAHLKFKRFGNLKTSAFATIQITKQYTHDNPGFLETEKVVHWGFGEEVASTSLRLVDDAIFDDERLVDIRLINGVNALVGEGCNMTVKIKDPEDGMYNLNIFYCYCFINNNFFFIFTKFDMNGCHHTFTINPLSAGCGVYST